MKKPKPMKPSPAWAVVDECGDIRYVALEKIEVLKFHHGTPDGWRIVAVKVTKRRAKK